MAQSTSYSNSNQNMKLNEPYYIETITKLNSEWKKEKLIFGFSIQLMAENSPKEIEQLYQELAVNPIHKALNPSLIFESPYYKLRIGNFIDKVTAYKYLMEYRKQFPSAILVSTTFTQSAETY